MTTAFLLQTPSSSPCSSPLYRSRNTSLSVSPVRQSSEKYIIDNRRCYAHYSKQGGQAEEAKDLLQKDNSIIIDGRKNTVFSSFLPKILQTTFLSTFFLSLSFFTGIYQITPDLQIKFTSNTLVNAISGGGKDFAEQDLKGSIFTKQKLNDKDFSGAQCQNCDFTGAQLRGARFYKSNLKGAIFEGADLTGASLEGSALDETSFRNTVLEGAYFSSSTLAKAGDIFGADFSEALLRDDMSKKLCDGNSKREKASGENPVTGVATRDSLLCD